MMCIYTDHDKAMKTKTDYLIDLLHEANSKRTTPTAARRAVKAMKELGIDEQGIVRVMGYLDYCDTAGNPWNPSIERCW